MGLYNVVGPCVVGRLHYTRPTTQPIEVDDAVAAPGVEAGCLVPYRPGADPADELVAHDEESSRYASAGDAGREAAEAFAEGLVNAEEAPKPRPRGRRRTED